MATSRPRISRTRSSARPTMLRSPTQISPVTAACRGSCRPRIARAVTLLLEPDSPTMPSVSPLATASETPSTARTTPSSVRNRTPRSFTRRYGAGSWMPDKTVPRLARNLTTNVDATNDPGNHRVAATAPGETVSAHGPVRPSHGPHPHRSGGAEGRPGAPGDGPVVDVTVGRGELHARAGDLDRVAVDRGLEIGLGVLGRQVDTPVADVVHPLVGDGVLVLVDELPVVADPHGPVLGDVGVAVRGVAHRGGFLLVHHDVDPGAGDPVRVADDVPAAVGGVIGGDGDAVLLDNHVVRVRVRQHDLIPADGEVAGHLVTAEGAAAERQTVEVGFDVHGGAGRPVRLGPPVQRGPGVPVVRDPRPGTVDMRGGGDGDVLLDLRAVGGC